MSKILISIRPEYVDKILSGEKNYEYRRTVAKKVVDELIMYSTAPQKTVVGTVEVLGVISLPVDELWNMTKKCSGISEEKFFEYFKGVEIAHAYKLGRVKKFKIFKKLDEYGVKYPPQSFIYIGG